MQWLAVGKFGEAGGAAQGRISAFLTTGSSE
jgi:hypothetical protein